LDKTSKPAHRQPKAYQDNPPIQNGPCDLIEDFGVKAV
jgi:hypothetical protein